MFEADKYNDLEIKAIAAAHLYEDHDDCVDEQQIDEYGDCEIAAHHYQNSGCGCLTIIVATLSMALVLLVLMM